MATKAEGQLLRKNRDLASLVLWFYEVFVFFKPHLKIRHSLYFLLNTVSVLKSNYNREVADLKVVNGGPT